MKLTFGKYNGWELRDVPDDYIEYMIESNKKSLTMFQNEQDRRISMAEARLPIISRLIQAGYRTLANQHHPDRGGDVKTMQDVNAAHEKLLEMIKNER